MEFGSSKCAHMWSGLFIAPTGGVRLCCISHELQNNVEINISDIDDIQTFFNSPHYVKKRQTDVRKLDLCIACHSTRAKSGAPTLKETVQKNMYDYHNISPRNKIDQCKIEHLDIAFSNLCNQQCLMCSSEYSSRWYKHDKQYNRNPIKYTKWGNEENLNKIKRILPQVKLLTIKGGEPTIQEEVYSILRYIVENDLETNVNIVSNFQEVSDEMMDLLCPMKHLHMNFSIDSTRDMYNWTRGGDFDITISNIKRYAKNCKYTPCFGYSNALNKWSLFSLIDDIKLMEKISSELGYNDAWYNILPVMGPRYVSPFILPREDRVKFVHKFEREFGIIDSFSKAYGCLTLNHLDTIIALENDAFEVTDDILDKSNEWKIAIDKIRGIK